MDDDPPHAAESDPTPGPEGSAAGGSPSRPDDDVTTLSAAAARGDHAAAEALFVAVYDQLRGIAAGLLRREAAGHMLQPTALVHEVYEKLMGGAPVDAEGTTHFRAIAVRAMGQVLIDHARHENRQKRGGNWRRVALDVALIGEDASQVDPLVLKETIDAMSAADPRLARVVQLRLFGELTHPQIAAMLGISLRQVERDWAMGRAWLRRRILGEDDR